MVDRKIKKQLLLEQGPPKCANDGCDNFVKFSDEKCKWNMYCSFKCRGVHNSKKSRDKARQTFLKKYGVESQFHSQEIKEKIKKTNLERYGAENPFSSLKIKEKIKKTNLERYGAENPGSLDHVIDKIKKTNLERYGVECPAKTDIIKEKIKKTNLERYGVIAPTQLQRVKDLIKKTNLEKYGVKSPKQSHLSKEVLELIENKNELEKLNKQMTVTALAEKMGCSLSILIRAYKKHNIQLKMHYTSSGEKAIYDFLLQELNLLEEDIICRDKSKIRHELDIYIPKYNIAIEYNGLYWHSEVNIDKNYHINKTNCCNNIGIDLIHVFEHDWKKKQDIIKSIIRNKLKLSKNYYARRLSIIELDKSQEKDFFNKNHIQGYIKSKICYALIDSQNNILCAMSFSKSRYNKKYEYELLRYCSVINCNVVGGAGKLFKHFIKESNPKNVISYCHRHLFSGRLYKNLNFCLLKNTKPGYYYTSDYTDLYNRQNFQKHKLKNILPNFDENLSEVENMKNNGYDRIWDCGVSVWGWKNEHHKVII